MSLFRRRAPSIRGHRVLITLKPPTDRTFKGLIGGEYEDAIILVDAVLLLQGGAEQEVGGRIRIFRQDVAWIEEL